MQNKYLILGVTGPMTDLPDAIVLPLRRLGELRSLADTAIELRATVKNFRSVEINWDGGQWANLNTGSAPAVLAHNPLHNGEATYYEGNDDTLSLPIDATVAMCDGHSIQIFGGTEEGEFNSQPFHLRTPGKLVYWGAEGEYTICLETGEVGVKKVECDYLGQQGDE